MPYQLLDHTADIRILVKAKDLAQLFSDALQATMHILNSQIKDSKKVIQRQIKLTSPDSTALLIDFLNQALLLSQTHQEIYHQVDFQQLTQQSLECQLTGQPVNSFTEDIKAVTYHQAEIKKNQQGEWQTMIVYDI